MNTSKTGRGLWFNQLAIVIVFASVLFFISNFLFMGFTEEALRLCIRGSARIAVVLFMLAFGATAIHRTGQNSLSFWVMMNRPYFGISFAIIHLIHLAFLLLLQQVFHPVFTLAESTELLAGGGAYVFVILMLLTSFQPFKKLLSRENWKRLHTLGGWWIWTVFMSSYWKRVFREEYGYIVLAILLALVGIGRLKTRLSSSATN